MSNVVVALACAVPLLLALAVLAFSYCRKCTGLKRELRLQRALIDVLASSLSVTDSVDEWLKRICAETGWAVACFHVVDSPRAAFKCVAAIAAEETYAEFCTATMKITYSGGNGLPGHVLSHAAAVEWDESNNHDFLRIGPAAQCGIKHGVACPVFVNDTVVAALEVFGPRRATSLSVVQSACSTIGRFLCSDLLRRQSAENESRWRAVIDTAPDGIVVVDANGVIESVNKAATDLLRYSEQEVVGRNVIEFVPDNYRDRFGSALIVYFNIAIMQLVGRNIEVVGQRKDGSTFPMEIAVSRLSFADKQMFTGTIRDISDRKLMERRVSEFYSTISHELRSPLASIRGSLGLIEGGAIGPVPEDILELITIAKRNCERLIRLINDILDAKKIEAGKLQVQKRVLRPEELIFSAIEVMQSFAAESKVSLVGHASEAPNIVGDADRIVQVLTNLLSNAIKYSSEGGQVDIYLAKAVNGEDYVRFCVQDRGPGIASDQLSMLFSEFQQLDSSDARPKSGTGLGLAISKSIVEQLDGSIGVDNQPGKGATFWFELPISKDLEVKWGNVLDESAISQEEPEQRAAGR